MPFDSFPRLVSCLLFAWTCFHAPGLALFPRRDSALPRTFVRVLWSAIVTTLVATILASLGRFSLPAVMIADLALAALSLPLRGLFAGPAAGGSVHGGSDFAGPLVFAASLAAFWPGYPGFLGASDSTAYVATGVSLAHHGTLWRDDELLRTVPAIARPILFDSMSQVVGSWGPPYRRMPGAMLVEDLEATRAWPDFFPVPSVWSAMFVQAGVTTQPAREQAAPNYAPVFAALALWAFWLLAGAWLGRAWGLAATVLLGASAPFYMFARLPMSEPIAAFFALSSLAVLARGSSVLRRGDALLAGAAMGAAVFTRVEMAMLVAIAMALQPSLERRDASTGSFGENSRPTAAFLIAMLLVAAATIVPAIAVPGTWQLPLLDHGRNAWITYVLKYGAPTIGEILVGAGVATTLVALAVRHFGLSATLRWGFLCAIVAGHAAASRWLWDRTPMWLSFAIGWQGIAMALLGAVLAWRSRERPAAATFVVALLAGVAVILFYNPHVYPALPWGARRFVPLLLPLAMLMAVHLARIASGRSRLLGALLLLLLAWPVMTAGRPLWGRVLVEGSYETLAQLDAALPRDGIVFVDREVSSVMAAPALWLVHDRNSITVPPTSSAAGHDMLPGLVWNWSGSRPIYFVTRGAGSQVRTPLVKMSLVARVPVSLLLFEQTYDRRPEKMQRFLAPLAIYRLETFADAKGAPVP